MNNTTQKKITSLISKKEFNSLYKIYFDNNVIEKEKIKILKLFKKNYSHKIKILFISNSNINVHFSAFKEMLSLYLIEAELIYMSLDEFLISDKKKLKDIQSIFLFIDANNLSDFSSYKNKIYYTKKEFTNIKKYLIFLFEELKKTKTKNIILSSIADIPNLELSDLSLIIDQSKRNLINKLNHIIIKNVKLNNFLYFDNANLANVFGLSQYYDYQKFYLANIPFSRKYAYFFSLNFAKFIKKTLGYIKKVFVFDLDNTIWGGVLVDDGEHNLEISEETKTGKIFYDIQRFIKNLKHRGIILAVASKNDHSRAMAFFKSNKKMVLKEDDISSFRINWENKYQNLISISEELNISLDQFIFFDDSDFERNQIIHYLPSVTVPNIGSDPTNYINILQKENLFQPLMITKEDILRSKTYVAARKNKKFKEKFENISDYLKSIKMIGKIENFQKNSLNRIEQLFQRTNQFNLTNKKYSLNEINKIINNKYYYCFQISLKDKFVDYGIISLVVCRLEGNSVFIENWVLSCRAYGKTMENYILNYIYKFFKNKKIDNIIGDFKSSKKNNYVSNLYSNFGFKYKKKDNNYILKIADYSNYKHYINI